MRQASDFFPVLGLQEFSKTVYTGDHLLYHELHGERLIESPHKHDFFIIMLFEKGEGKHIIDFKEYAIGNRQVHLLFPGQVHAWQIQEKSMGYQLMISRQWFENFMPSLQFATSYYYQTRPVFEISQSAYQSMLYEFKAIQQEIVEKEISWDIVQTRIKLISLLLSKSVEKEFKDFEKYNATPILSRFLTLINQHFAAERLVSFYAEKLNITPNYLNIICKKTLNSPASSLIKERLILESKRLLKVSDLPMKDIVYRLGFYDHADFSKFFKKKTGMTPSQFKEVG
ncbi:MULTISPECIES: helix-turn-helix domain-containing protein [Sphingobacterium]|uniref:helix-turn-helix domain-containing protein n=1 Tax=Sphingobacterium TaxID=28453 RepID=UPI0013DD615C|nr:MULTISPECIES: helix-turn-helix transcriptional regulator [unclassified Sphingobacterium]